jgi:hypothetical protein
MPDAPRGFVVSSTPAERGPAIISALGGDRDPGKEKVPAPPPHLTPPFSFDYRTNFG